MNEKWRKRNKRNFRKKNFRSGFDRISKKGFEGARVDEIARQAGVNKALLYYYFDSKEKILEAIFEETKKDFVAGKSKALTSNLTNRDTFDNHLQAMDAKERMKNIVTVAFAESFKERGQPNYLFELVDDIMFGILKEGHWARAKKLIYSPALPYSFLPQCLNLVILCWAKNGRSILILIMNYSQRSLRKCIEKF